MHFISFQDLPLNSHRSAEARRTRGHHLVAGQFWERSKINQCSKIKDQILKDQIAIFGGPEIKDHGPGEGQQIDAVPNRGGWQTNWRGQEEAASGAQAAFTAPTRYGWITNYLKYLKCNFFLGSDLFKHVTSIKNPNLASFLKMMSLSSCVRAPCKKFVIRVYFFIF